MQNGGMTPLHTASMEGHTNIMKFLLDHGALAVVNNPCVRSPWLGALSLCVNLARPLSFSRLGPQLSPLWSIVGRWSWIE
jgi:ankyrin repeat protein